MPSTENHHPHDRAVPVRVTSPAPCRSGPPSTGDTGLEPDERALLFTLTEVRRRTGLTRKALRVYEELGLVRPAGRTSGGYRLYDNEALRHLKLVTRARGLGLSLAEAEEFLHAANGCCGDRQGQLAAIVARKLSEIARRMAELQALQERLEQVVVGLAVTEAPAAPGCEVCRP